MPALAPIVDDFEVIGLDEYTVYENTGTMVVEEGGVLKLRLGVNSLAYTGVISTTVPSFRDVAVVIELVMPPTNIIGAQCGFYVQDLDKTNSDGFLYEGNALFAYNRSAAGVPYDPIAHRWLRLREHAGMLYFDARPAMGTWVTLISVAAAAWMDGPVLLRVEAGTYKQVASPGEAHFDNLDLPPSGC